MKPGKRMKPLEEIRSFRSVRQPPVEFHFYFLDFFWFLDKASMFNENTQNLFHYKKGKEKIKLNSLWGPSIPHPAKSSHDFHRFPFDQEQKTSIWQSHLWSFKGWSVIPGKIHDNHGGDPGCSVVSEERNLETFPLHWWFRSIPGIVMYTLSWNWAW